MTKKTWYIVRLEEDGHTYWLGADYDQSECNEYFSVFGAKSAASFDSEEEAKEALEHYYKETHEKEENDKAFLCKVTVQDIDILSED